MHTPYSARNLAGVTSWMRRGAYDSSTGTWSKFQGNPDWLQGTAANQPALVNGAPQFDGVNDFLSPTTVQGRLQDLFSASAKTMLISFIVTTATGNNTPALYTNGGVICDSGGYFGVFCRTAGKVAVYNWDGAAQQMEADYTLGTKAVVAVTHDGVTLSYSLNGNAWQTTPSGPTQSVVGNFNMGRSYLNIYTGCTIYELITCNIVNQELLIRKTAQAMLADMH